MSETVSTTAGSQSLGFWAKLMAVDSTAMIISVIGVVVTLVITVIIAKIVRTVFLHLEKKMNAAKNSNVSILSFFRHIVLFLIYFGGVVSAIGYVPHLDSTLRTLLGAGGVLAVIAGFASQEALGSVVSGMMILAFKPFVLGDIVRYVDGNISGVVEEITLHHTTIRTWENKRVIIPNSKMNSAVIENADYRDSKVCRFLDLGITYESDIEKAKTIMIQVIGKHPDFLDNRTAAERAEKAPEVLVRVHEFAESAVILRAMVWAKNNGAAVAMHSDLLQELKKAFEKNGIDLAYPHLVLINKT